MDKQIIVGITQGDTNGIGMEVIIKALSDMRMMDNCIPILYGSSRIFGVHHKLISEARQINTNIVNSAADAHAKRLNIINCVPDSMAIEIGQPTTDGAKAAIISLQSAVKDYHAGLIDAIVTAPINKHTVGENGFKFPGHTEFLSSEFGGHDGLMFLCSDTMKIGVATNHIPVSNVRESLSQELLIDKLRIMNSSLMRDFNIVRPKIAVLGLNPHAGDGGTLGTAEQEIIIPAIAAANQENILAFGPYSPDGFFGTNSQYKFDAVLAMYHDQGLIPFKTLAFDKGVNFTAGLPVVRTSPDHGTGFDIAGKNMANPMSMIYALYMAVDVCNNRRKYDAMHKNQ
ncbi:MAG: 4-hydroxythreonine-4-phosphate dehydrogenase PdxA [Bacteroidales bacterium]|nr:4-hydroxythreonine-4-phosphate dehydrogenase PdxA [Bacteroidales bacterium]